MFHMIAKAGLENRQWIYKHPSSMSTKPQGASKTLQLIRYYWLQEEPCSLQLTLSFSKDGLRLSIASKVIHLWKVNKNYNSLVLKCSPCPQGFCTHLLSEVPVFNSVSASDGEVSLPLGSVLT